MYQRSGVRPEWSGTDPYSRERPFVASLPSDLPAKRRAMHVRLRQTRSLSLSLVVTCPQVSDAFIPLYSRVSECARSSLRPHQLCPMHTTTSVEIDGYIGIGSYVPLGGYEAAGCSSVWSLLTRIDAGSSSRSIAKISTRSLASLGHLLAGLRRSPVSCYLHSDRQHLTSARQVAPFFNREIRRHVPTAAD